MTSRTLHPHCRILWAAALLLAGILAGCRLQEAPAPTAEPTLTPVSSPTSVPESATPPPSPTAQPTSTSTPEPTNTPTPEPSATPTPTPLSVMLIVPAQARTGPGEAYPEVVSFSEPVTLTLYGCSELGDWLAVGLSEGERGWVPASQVVTGTLHVGLKIVPTPEGLATVTPAPVPAISLYVYEAFGKFFQCNRKVCDYVMEIGLNVKITTRVPNQAFSIEISDPKGAFVRKVSDKTDGEGFFHFRYPSKKFTAGVYTVRVWTPEGHEKTATINIVRPLEK